jgi:hypothetical protein
MQRFLLSSALLIGTTAPVFADITPEQLWARWTEDMKSVADTVVLSQLNSLEDGILVEGLTLGLGTSEDGVIATLAYPPLKMTQRADGSVDISLGGPVAISVVETLDDTGPLRIGGEILTSGFNMVASGDVNDLSYTYGADAVDFSVNAIAAENTHVEGNIRAQATSVQGTRTDKTSDLRAVSQNITAGGVAISARFSDHTSGGAFEINGRVQEPQFTGSVTSAAGTYPLARQALFAPQSSFETTYNTGLTDLVFSAQDSTGSWTGTIQQAQSSTRAASSATRIEYSQDASDMTFTLAGALPLPTSAILDQVRIKGSAPITFDPIEPEPEYAVEAVLAGLQINESVWSIFDPRGGLDRSAATVSVSVSGTGEFTNAGHGPFAPKTVRLNDITLTALGATATGQGDMHFVGPQNPIDLTMPAMAGKAEFTFSGVTEVMNTMAQLGILAPEQLFGAKMMMGFFTRPAENGTDLQTTIEMRENGEQYINGQRVR